jgi:hypothetical protein
MEEINSLRTELSRMLNINKAQNNFLADMLVALIKAQSANLYKIATYFPGTAQKESHYTRIQRFMAWFPQLSSVVAQFISRVLPLGANWLIILDRTDWEFGQFTINILFLAVAFKGIAIPLFWIFLPKKGNSNTEERIELMQRFIDTFGAAQIQALLADREFIGRDWICWLQKQKIKFRIRIRKNTKVYSRFGQRMDVYLLFRSLRVQESIVLNKKRLVWGIPLYLIGLKTPDEYLILITDDAPKRALADYKIRWNIETMFGCLKSRGFNLEDTHLKDPHKIRNILACITMAFCWSCLVGDWQDQMIPIKIKKHGRKARGIFRKGIDFLINTLENLQWKAKDFQRALETLVLNYDMNKFLIQV